jgi:hypothetical protein
LHFLRIRFSPYAFHQHQQLIILTLGKIYWRIFAHKIKNAIFLKDCISWFPQKENYPRPKVVVVKQSYDKEKVKDWIPFFFFFFSFLRLKNFSRPLACHVTEKVCLLLGDVGNCKCWELFSTFWTFAKIFFFVSSGPISLSKTLTAPNTISHKCVYAPLLLKLMWTAVSEKNPDLNVQQLRVAKLNDNTSIKIQRKNIISLKNAKNL